MLIQFHHHFSDKHTEFVAQRELNSFTEVCREFEDISTRFPCPDGADWLLVQESSRKFRKGLMPRDSA